jgi:hypothetical protein
VGAVMLLFVYAQALTGIVPLGGKDALARLLGAGFHAAANSLAAATGGAGPVLTTDYETTAWLRFYEPGLKVVQVGETWRYPTSPMATQFPGPVLYFVEKKRDQSPGLRAYFSNVELATQLLIKRNGAELSDYEIWVLNRQKAPVPGRMP